MQIEEYVINEKLNLFISNYESIRESKGAWNMGMMKYSCALSATIKTQNINPIKIEEAQQLIKKNTSIFSNFRGHSLPYLSTLLSNKSNSENSIRSILNIYDKLKENGFRNDTYLTFVAIIIYENKEKMDVDTAISKTKYVYDYMKKHHPFLTSTDDYCRAALIAIHSKDLDYNLDYIEESYNKLNNNGFFKSNNLQSLSHIMSFDGKKTGESINRVLRIKDLLEQNSVRVDGYGYPLIGAVALLECNEDILVEQVKTVSEKLKKISGFGSFSLGTSNRNMISMALVASCYGDCFNSENNLDAISNNIFVDIIIAIEVATMIAIIAATTAASASN